MKLSIVTAMYKSEGFVKPFYEQCTALGETISDELEIIFVDDRSPDQSAAVVEELLASDKRVRLIQLSRNFGQSAAMLAGMTRATGDYVYTSDIDLEDPPELMVTFHQMMRDDRQLQSAYGYMMRRQGRLLERWVGRLFYILLGVLSQERIPHQVWSRMMTRKFLDALLQFTEYHLFWSGLFHHVGFKQVGVPVERRKTGTTSYNFARKLELALSAITSFSVSPLKMIFVIGTLVSLGSFTGVLYLVWRHHRGDLVPGWASIVLSVLMVGGVTNLSIGLIGIYVGRIFIQSKRRPIFLVDREL